MKILLVQTPSVETFTSEKVYPIGIVILAGCLQKVGHQVAILDMNLEPDPHEALHQKLLYFHPEVVGLSLRNVDPLGNKTCSLIPPFVVTVKLIRAWLPEAAIIAGGTGFSLFPERIMREVPEIRYGLVGEGERTLPALLASFDSPRALPGLCYRTGESVVVNPPDREYDLTNYLRPDRALWSPEPYININSYAPSIGIETKRGCPLNCAYCVYPALQGRRFRCRSAVSVVDEIEILVKEYGVKNFHFNDSVLNVPSGHLEGICREILKRKLSVRWDGFFREDHLDEHNIALFEEAGCECFSFSPDGLCQEALEVLGKGMSVEDVLRAARLASERETMSVYHFMVNFPGQTAATARKSFEMLERLYDLHSKRRNLGTVVLNNIRILPGTRMEELARAEGVIGPETDLLYPVYYIPRQFETLRYQLETFHLCKNAFMWKGVTSSENSVAGASPKDTAGPLQ